MPAISAIICTHNPRNEYLVRVLASLRKQTLSHTDWELVVVDNRSDEPLAGRVDLSWHSRAKIIREEAAGLSNARICGILASQGDLILFIDDDNVLDAAYLENCLSISTEWPHLGVWGGAIVPELEIEPAEHIRPHLSKLALRGVARPLWSNLRTCVDAEPWGAGLCVRKAAALAYCEYFKTTKLRILDRVNKTLLSGGDTELCYVVCSLGLGMGLFPQLKLLHLIPQSRLTDDYMIKISHGLTATNLLLNYKWSGIIPKSPYSPIELLRCVKQLMVLSAFERRLAWSSYRARITATNLINTNVRSKLSGLSH